MCATAGLVSCKANLAAPATTAPAVVPGAPIATPSELAAAPGATAAPATNATATSDESRDEECTEGCDSSEIDDEGGSSAQAATTARPVRSPLDGWSQSQIESELVAHPEKLGSMSIGNTNAGALFNGVQMPKGDRWEVVDPNHAWGTRETVDYLVHCLNEVEQRFPGAAEMFVGQISGRHGGHLSPHVSHQAGRDVDISYYYVAGRERWYAKAGPDNLDLPRTWAFVKTLVTDTDVEMILMDRSIQKLVRDYATAQGEDRRWVDALFDGEGSLPPLIRHAKGHATHLHVRFYNPVAQETGRRAYSVLLRHHVIQPSVYFVRHKVKEGETLGLLARKYGVTEKEIQQANGMKTTAIRTSREYKIPRRGGVVTPRMTAVPPRRIPPDRGTG